MTDVMMMLGQYQFSIPTAAYQSLRRSAEYRWPAQERIGRRPALQFVGAGAETIELEGSIYPHYWGGLEQTQDMRDAAGDGIPLRLVDGRGFSWGLWAITAIDEQQSVFFENGDPRRIDFRMSLARYGEDM